MANVDYSKQDFLALVSAAIEKLKGSEPELSEALEKKLVFPELKVDVPRGKLVCGTARGEATQAYVGLETKDGDYIDLYMAESQDAELAEASGYEKDDVIAYMWEDLDDEDYTRKVVYDKDAFERYEEAVKGEEKE